MKNRNMIYGTQAIIPLQEKDFTLLDINDADGIWIVMFYDDSTRSERLKKAWTRIAQQIVGIKIAACNIKTEQVVEDSFLNLSQDHLLFGPKWPLFVIYEDGTALGKYRGDYDEEELSNWVQSITFVYNQL